QSALRGRDAGPGVPRRRRHAQGRLGLAARWRHAPDPVHDHQRPSPPPRRLQPHLQAEGRRAEPARCRKFRPAQAATGLAWPAMGPRSWMLTLLAVCSLLVACATPAPVPSSTPNVMLMEEGFVDNNGVLLYYKAVGYGRPLVIVHGGPGASHDYLLPNLYR